MLRRSDGGERRDLTFHFTVDVDWVPGSEKGVLALYEFALSYRLKPTLFFAGRFAQVYGDVVKEGVRRGYEIGTHGWDHGIRSGVEDEDFSLATPATQTQWLELSSESVEKACGVVPRAFRAPNLRISGTTIRLLEKSGYLFDSSVPAGRLTVGFGRINSLSQMTAPLMPYHPGQRNIARPGDSHILEVPPSAWGVPINMSALRFLGLSTLRWAVSMVARTSRNLVFYAHPSEFVSASEQQLPAGNPKRHLNGLGPGNFAILGRFIEFVLAKGYQPRFLGDIKDQ